MPDDPFGCQRLREEKVSGTVSIGPRAPARGLTRGVDMTSDVKGWEQLFYVCIIIFSFGLSEEPEPVKHDG